MPTKLDYRSTHDIEMLAPVRRRDKTTITSGTCTGRLYDSLKRNELAKAASAGQAKVTLKDQPRFEIGDVARLSQAAGVFQELTVLLIDWDTKVVTFSGNLTAASPKGSRILSKLGADLTMLPFNAAGASYDTKDWGFRIQVTPAHVGVYVDMTVQAEAVLDDGAGTIITRSKLVEFTDGV